MFSTLSDTQFVNILAPKTPEPQALKQNSARIGDQYRKRTCSSNSLSNAVSDFAGDDAKLEQFLRCPISSAFSFKSVNPTSCEQLSSSRASSNKGR